MTETFPEQFRSGTSVIPIPLQISDPAGKPDKKPVFSLTRFENET